MKNMKHALSVLPFATLLAACSEIPLEAHYNRGAPEGLLDISSEVVNVGLGSHDGLAELARALDEDVPGKAVLSCAAADAVCAEARTMLEQRGVALESGQGEAGVALMYDRVIARDCEQRYIDNSINPYNLHHPTFGCSVAANMVQAVTDKREFADPKLLDYYDGHKAVQVINGYAKTPPVKRDDGSILSGGSNFKGQ